MSTILKLTKSDTHPRPTAGAGGFPLNTLTKLRCRGCARVPLLTDYDACHTPLADQIRS
jgi:hypothetical protein